MPFQTAQPPAWVKDAIFYQIFPDRFSNGDPANDPRNCEPWGNPPTPANFFGGDLAGIAQKLDYLQRLKINALYLTPIFQAETNHRYDTTDYYNIDPALGTNTSFQYFVNQLHERGLRIILDGVFNHTGDSFPQFQNLLQENERSPYKDWYLVHKYPLQVNPTSYETCGGCTYLPKLNIHNSEVRSYLLDVARFWLFEACIDGWRLDSAVKISQDFWQEFRQVVKTTSPQAYIVGEVWWEPTPWLNNATFDGGTNYLLRTLILTFFARREMDAEDFRVEIDSLITRLGEAAYFMLNFLSSHDTPRAYSLFHGEVKSLRLAIIFLFCMVGAPLIYYGDEIGLPGGNDPDCRRCMIWDTSQWNEQVLACYEQMATLRSAQEALRRGGYESLLAFERLFVFRRFTENENILIVLNAGNAAEEIRIDTHSDHATWIDYLTGQKFLSEHGFLTLSNVPATSALILIGKPAGDE